MKTSSGGTGAQQGNASVAAAEVEKKSINAELWQTCAGPLVNIPAAGTYVVYFPQGHSEQVAASLKKEGDAQIPNYANLPSKLLCILRNVTLHADPETDEVYAQMTLQPVPLFDKEAVLRSELSMKVNKPHTEFFCKNLTASDTSTHGGFSVPRRAAEKIFRHWLDFTMQPPAQEIVARDLHDYVWNFRHIYRGQPKRHLLTTGWSLFVSGKRLLAGDSVLFIRDEKQQLLLGIRRATRQSTNLSLSVLSTDSMHIGILAAAAHAAANNSPFTIFYNPRTSPSEFVIPLAKYYKAVYNYQISPGMRFRMLFETEESGTRRYMGTITGINDLDPIRWKGSQWRNIQVGWDESVAGEKRNRVSIWEIEPVTAPFFICPAPSLLSSKRPRPPGMLDDDSSDFNRLFMRSMPWLGDDFGLKDAQAMPGLSFAQWMNMRQNPSLANSVLPNYMNSLASSALPNLQGANITYNLGLSETQIPQQNNLPFSPQMPTTQAIQQLDQLQKLSSSPLNPSGSSLQSLQQLTDVTQPPRQRLLSQTMPTSQVQSEILQSHSHSQAQNVLPQQHSLPNHQLHSNLSPIMSQQQQLPVLSHPQQHNPMSSQIPDHVNQQLHGPQNQLPHQLLQNLHPNQQFLLAQQSAVPQPSQMNHLQDQSKQLFDIPPNFPRSVSASQMLDVAQAMPSQSNQKCAVTSESSGNAGNPSRPIYNQLSAGSSSLLPGPAPCGVQPAVSDDAPSCSTSPSTNNCPNAAQSITNGRHQQTGMMRRDEIAWSSATLSKNPCVMETLPSSNNLVNDILVEANAKPSLNIPKSQNQNFLGLQAYVNAPGAQTDGLDSSSSVTSVLSQNDAQVPPGNVSMPFNSQPMFFRYARENWNVQDDPRSNAPFESSIENQFGMPTTPQHLSTRRMGLGKDFPTDESCGGGMVSSYQNAQQDAQPEPSSSMVSQSFGVPDLTFNSIDSTINNGSFMNTGAWAPPQFPRMRTFTKVYKRGAVGRSIDITRYSGYGDLKQDLARRFGIEGQLEDRQKIGWKLVYVDHENDVLLVGDDPWEEFVNCVRCIKILSPQEVEQMSLAGDFGSSEIIG